jgi:hypothetical protein
MLLPCGHVIAKVSMGKLARGHARNAALACELAPPSLHARTHARAHARPVLSRPRMRTSRYLPLAASRPCVRADAYREAHGVGEAGLFRFRFKCPYCPTEQMTSQCRELHF